MESLRKLEIQENQITELHEEDFRGNCMLLLSTFLCRSKKILSKNIFRQIFLAILYLPFP